MYKVVYLLTLWIKSRSMTIQMKATEQLFSVVLFIIMYTMELTFESVGKILTWEHSNGSHCGTVYCAVQGD